MPVSAPQRPARAGAARRPLPSRATAPDAALVALAARGDERAFELLFQRHRADVHGYALRMLRDHARAEDVVQDVFVSAVRAIRGAAPEAQPVHVRAWLREIARKACIDQWRGSTRRGEVSLDAPDALRADDALRLADDSLDRVTSDRRAVATLRRAFDDLPELQHRILVQRELEGRSIPEIADRLGLTATVVEGQLARGRRTLGRSFKELDSGERCRAVRALCDAAVGGALGVRDRHRLGSHVRGCDACRRYARTSGVDARLVDRALLGRASLLLPLPLLRRLPFEPGLAGDAAGGVLGAKALVGAAVLAAAGGGGAYVAGGAPVPSLHRPTVGATASASASATGRDGRPVVRLTGRDGVVTALALPVGPSAADASAAGPYAPPWLVGEATRSASRGRDAATLAPAPAPSAAPPAPTAPGSGAAAPVPDAGPVPVAGGVAPAPVDAIAPAPGKGAPSGAVPLTPRPPAGGAAPGADVPEAPGPATPPSGAGDGPDDPAPAEHADPVTAEAPVSTDAPTTAPELGGAAPAADQLAGGDVPAAVDLGSPAAPPPSSDDAPTATDDPDGGADGVV